MTLKKTKITNYYSYFSQKLGLDVPYFLGGGFWVMLSLFISFIGGMILSVLFARIWSKPIYGQFSLIMSLLSLASFTTLPSMGQVVTQEVSEGKDGIYKPAMKAVLIWSILGSLFLTIVGIYYFLSGNKELIAAIIISALAFPISSGFNLYTSFLNGKKLFKKLSIFNTIAQFASLIATGLAILVVPSLFWVAFFSAWSTAIINLVLTLFTLKDITNNKVDKKGINFGKQLSYSQFFTIAPGYFDRLLIPIILGFSANAVYSFAILIPLQMSSFFKVFLMVGQPRMAQISNKNLKATLRKKSLQLEIFIVFTVLLYILLSPFLFSVLYPSYKSSALQLSQIYAISLLYFPINLYGLGLIKFRATKSIYISNVSFGITLLVSLLVLLPKLGLLGAVFSTIIARVVQSFASVYTFHHSDA